MSYILQHPDFGLGNFINLTPAIRWLSEREQRRIPVFFTKDYVRECFVRCPFIEILNEQPDANPLFGSNLVNPNNDKPDYQYVFEYVTGEKWSEQWHTYVDHVKDVVFRPYKSHIVIINGAGNNAADYIARKDPGQWAYREQIAKVKKVFNRCSIIAVGSEDDADRNEWFFDVADSFLFGDTRGALAIIQTAKYIIANDTGLAHAAGAMNKPLTVLVKDSPRERIKNPGKNTQYVYL